MGVVAGMALQAAQDLAGHTARDKHIQQRARARLPPLPLSGAPPHHAIMDACGQYAAAEK